MFVKGSIEDSLARSQVAPSDRQHARVLTAVKAPRYARPPLRGADGLDDGSAHARTGSCRTKPIMSLLMGPGRRGLAEVYRAEETGDAHGLGLTKVRNTSRATYRFRQRMISFFDSPSRRRRST